MKMKTVAVVGAGFCGAMMAVHLLRQPPSVPLQIVLVNRSGKTARGVAYGTSSTTHVLNVPAGRMSAFGGEENGFHEFVRRLDPAFEAGSFVPRSLYGDYLDHLLTDAVHCAPAGCSLRTVVGNIVRIVPANGGDGGDGGNGARLTMSDGAVIDADRVVLCVGNYAPADPPIGADQRSFYMSSRYIRDPWSPGILSHVVPDRPALVIGTGLTMLDIVLELRNRGHRAPIYAVSRRGLLPQAHRGLDNQPSHDDSLVDAMLLQPGARHYMRVVSRSAKQAAAAGRDWRDVIGSLRARTPQLWHALPLAERQRFLRRLRSYWEVHRHRCAPQLGARMQSELASGALRVLAGSVTGYRQHDDHVTVTLKLRAQAAPLCVEVASVINCTGPAANVDQIDEPLLNGLRADGLLVPDVLGLGFEIDDEYRLIARDGEASRWLYYVGPFLKGRDWEATAVPELRRHVATLIDVLHRSDVSPKELRV
ncbi:hydroxyacylglutathione hydrolase [Burkholderia sp. A27]|nr:hydroxyacylglutathione hydrolase [Burkholderia sp. A27]